MKKILLSAIAVVALMSSCKKDDDNNSTSSNHYSINGTNYDATVTVLGNTMFGTSGAATTSLTVSFDALPTADGTYTIGISPSSSVVAVGATTNGKAYLPTGTPAVSAAVTVSGGKVKIVMPEFWAKSPMDANDSVKVSGTLIQP